MDINPEIGRYRLQERIPGSPGIWFAEDLEDTGTQVVVKFVAPDSDVFGFRQQQTALAELEEPGVVSAIDSGESLDGKPFFVYPSVAGHTLREVLNEGGPLGLRRAGGLVREIGRMLARVHAVHIAHGGLDPEHILIAHAHGRDSVSLINFGAWRVSQQPSTPLGYLAPEARAGQVTASGDVFSLAAVAAEMLTGRRAFRYGSEVELEKQQRIGMSRGSLRKLRHKIPTRVEDEIRRGLAFDPLHRPADIQVFAAKIADTLAEGERMPLRRVLLFGALLSAVAAASAYRTCGHR